MSDFIHFLKNGLILLKDFSLDLFIAFGPSLNYAFQAKKFYKTKSSKGFSNYLCLVTILSHTLKIFFWFGERFKYTLLIQSILAVCMQLYLIYLVIKYQDTKSNMNNLIYNNNDNKKCKNLLKWSQTLNYKLIWRWNNVIEYYKFYFLIIFILTLFTFLLYDNSYYINIIGGISIFLEMLCSFPQIIELYRTKNSKNISKIMVFMWFCGNNAKIYYNYVNKSPIQLIIGSYVQVFCNCILIFQIFYYSRDKPEPINNFNMSEIKYYDSKDEKKEEFGVEELHLIDNKENNKIDYL